MKIKKVLLLSPPAITFKASRDINPLPQLGLGYLASVVKNLGIEVKILDCLIRGWDNEEDVDGRLIRVGLSDNKIKEFIADFDPDLVGINCQFSRQFRVYHQLFDLIKKIKPGCLTIAGGAHATVCPQELLQDKFCDYVLIGEAEETFKEFILGIVNDKSVSGIDGLCWKSGEKLHVNEKRRWIDNLDSIAFPAYEAMELDRYFGINVSHGLRHKERFSPIITSRGCVAKCIFCSANKVWGAKFRFRSVENILEEMRLLRSRYGIEELMFEDDNLTANPIRAKELFEAMEKERFNFAWDTPNGIGAWSIDTGIIDSMKKSGCVQLNFPVESGSQKVLTGIIKKPLNLSKVKLLIEHCRKIELNYGMFLVIGLPGEKLKDIWKSFRFAARCKCFNPFISVATPYPGTALFSECQKERYFTRDFTLDDLFISSFMIKTPDWSQKQLQKILLRGMVYLKIMSVFNDPRIMLRSLIQSLLRPRVLIGNLKKLYHKYFHIKKSMVNRSYW